MQNTKKAGQPVLCQLLSFIPREIVSQAVEKYDADKYYKTRWSAFVMRFDYIDPSRRRITKNPE